MTTGGRRRRASSNPFGQVPGTGGYDPEATQTYVGLADELRAEGPVERAEPDPEPDSNPEPDDEVEQPADPEAREPAFAAVSDPLDPAWVSPEQAHELGQRAADAVPSVWTAPEDVAREPEWTAAAGDDDPDADEPESAELTRTERDDEPPATGPAPPTAGPTQGSADEAPADPLSPEGMAARVDEDAQGLALVAGESSLLTGERFPEGEPEPIDGDAGPPGNLDDDGVAHFALIDADGAESCGGCGRPLDECEHTISLSIVSMSNETMLRDAAQRQGLDPEAFARAVTELAGTQQVSG